MYLRNYPQINQCVSGVEQLVKKLRENPDFELEARFGVKKNNRFETGVTRETMDRIIELMESCPTMSYNEEWNEVFGTEEWWNNTEFDWE